LKLKPLAEDEYIVFGVVENDACSVEQFLIEGEDTTFASRKGLLDMMNHISENGLNDLPYGWTHEANKKEKIYELIKGKLRIFYFKGAGNHIAVCCGTDYKSQRKANKGEVEKATKYREGYFEAVENNTLEIERENGTQ
jgi:hypothetical protein